MKTRFNSQKLALRSPEERDAIARYCAGAHPSNVPQDVDRAQWAFDRNPDGSLTACLLVAFLMDAKPNALSDTAKEAPCRPST